MLSIRHEEASEEKTDHEMFESNTKECESHTNKEKWDDITLARGEDEVINPRKSSIAFHNKQRVASRSRTPHRHMFNPSGKCFRQEGN